MLIFFCQDCKVYMCNKCESFHSKLLKNHYIYKLEEKNKNDIFSVYCKEKDHLEILDFFCKEHNQLCCTSCICKIKCKKYGQHANCNICVIEDIKDEKKNQLKENIKKLEEFSNNIQESINKIKLLYEKMNINKEQLKLKIQKIFTRIRNTVNDREDELLLEIDKKYDNIYFNEQLIKDSDKLENKIKLSLEKGKMIDKEWNNQNKLNILINDCINIENIVKNINIINENINKFNKLSNFNIKFVPEEENQINQTLEIIKNFGCLSYNNIFYNSKILNNNIEYINSIKNWINFNENTKAELLYRLSDNGEAFSDFHNYCDNKGPNLILFHINDGNKVGIYTTLSWDKNTGNKNDKETFLFNLNKNKKYRKINENKSSIYCYSTHGPYAMDFGCGSSCGTMKKIVHHSYSINNYFENASEILPSNKKAKYYDLLEIEIFKIVQN